MGDVSKIKATDGTTYDIKDGLAVANITRSSNTFTATRRDGTTFTFTQKDNNTTYTLGTDGNNVTLTPSSGSEQSITVPYATSAGSATKATQDSDGNAINTTYLKLSGGTMTGNIIFPNTVSIYQNQNNTSNYTTIVEWKKGGTSQASYDPEIGQHNTGGSDKTGSIILLPYATDTDPWGGSVGLYIAKNTIKLDNKYVGRFTANPTSGQVVITADTDGGVKSSGYTIATSVPSGAKFTDTVYSAGTGLTLSGTQFSVSSANASTIINLLSTGDSAPSDADYYVAQYAGGGTSTTSYHRRPHSALWSYIKGKADTIYSPIGHTHDYIPLITYGGLGTVSGGGQYSWFKIATLTITSSYVNGPVIFELSQRQYAFSTIQVCFVSANNKDPGLSYFTTDYDNHYYIKKTDTSTWELYGAYNEKWGGCSLHRVSGYRCNNGVSVSVAMTNISAPTDVTQVSYGGNVAYATSAGNASTVNNLTVQTAVPLNAKFTDTTYTATTTSIGSASAGTAIAADDITKWSAGTLPSLTTTTIYPVTDIEPTSGNATTATVSDGVLTITTGSSPLVSVAIAKPTNGVKVVDTWSAGTLPSLSYTARSIPNISVTSKTVATGITAS